MKRLMNFCVSAIEKRMPLFRFLLWFFIGNVCLFWLIGSRYLLILLSSKTLFTTTFHTYSSFSGMMVVYLFTLITFIGHFSLLIFLPLFCLVAPLILLFNNRIVTFSSSVIIATLSTIMLLADSVVFSIYHFHLNVTVLNLALTERHSFMQFFNISALEMIFILSICTAVLVFEICLMFFVWYNIILKKRCFYEMKITAFLFTSLFLSYVAMISTISSNNNVFAQQTPNLPLYNNILALILPVENSFSILERYSETRFSQPLFPVSPLNYPLHALNFKPEKKPFNIVIIGIDAWRFDAINKILTPNIDAFSKKSWRFQQHFSGGNSTQPGLFSLFYSLPGNYWTSMLQQHHGSIFIHELIKKGYETKVSFSADMLVPPFNDTIFSEVTHIRTETAPGDTIPDHDRATTKEFIHSIASRDQNKPFFGFIFYDSVHGYCGSQNIPRLFSTSSSNCDRLISNNQFKTEDLFNRYKNAVHFVDSEISQVLAALKKNKMMDNTVIIITGDHGEEFNDNGQNYYGHGGNYTHYQIQTPLVIYWPHQAAKTWTKKTSHYDIVPFLMEKILGCRNPKSDYSIGKALLDEKEQAYLLVGSYINMAIVEKNRSTTLLTSGNIRIADNQANDIPDANPDMNILSQALLSMRKYYKHDAEVADDSTQFS